MKDIESGYDYLDIKIESAKKKFEMDDHDLLDYFLKQACNCHLRIVCNKSLEEK